VTANAGDLEILVNGKTMPPLDAGLFARGVALDPQKLKSAPGATPVSAPAKPVEPTPAANATTKPAAPETPAAKPASPPAAAPSTPVPVTSSSNP